MNIRFQKRVTQHDNLRLARDVVLGQEQAAVQRRGSEQMKQAGRRAQGFDALRLIEAEQRAAIPSRDRHLGEGLVLVADVDVLPGDGQSWGILMPGERSQRIASRSGSGYGSGLSSSALTTLKMAVLAPMPSASDATMTKVRPRVLVRVRSA